MATPTTPAQDSHAWLNWQSEELQAYTDWKIVVSVQGKRRNETVYRVHRLVLAASPRKSGYFASVFLSDMAESKDKSSHILLEDSLSAELFPRVLDFCYSAELDVQNKITTDEAKLCLFSLADYFDIPTLKKELIKCCIFAIGESGMENIRLYLEQTDGRNDRKELFDAVIENCAKNLAKIPKNNLGDMFKPEWLVRILQVAVVCEQDEREDDDDEGEDDEEEQEDDDEGECPLPHVADELIARFLLSYKDDDSMEIDTVDELLSFVHGYLTPKNAVRFLTFLDTVKWEEFDYIMDYTTFVADFATETPAVNLNMEQPWVEKADKELSDAEEKMEGVDLGSFLSDQDSEEWNDHASFRAKCVDAIVNGWEELCDEEDEEMVDLICNLEGKVLFAMARAATHSATDEAQGVSEADDTD